jgi:hypothetical protein
MTNGWVQSAEAVQPLAGPMSVNSLAEDILSGVGSDRSVIQEYCPLACSIEWQLGQQYWQERGSKAFRSDAKPVPYLINNDGNFSLSAAEVLFASLLAEEQAGRLPSQVFCLELGIGVGLFARLFLDAFQDLCQQRGKDYFDRLTYIAADRSESMLLDSCRHGVFANHPGRYILRVVDAVRPVECLQNDLVFAKQAPRPLHAVFLNYILDCLPPTILELQGDEVRELFVRTCLARGVKLEEYTDLRVESCAVVLQPTFTVKFTACPLVSVAESRIRFACDVSEGVKANHVSCCIC